MSAWPDWLKLIQLKPRFLFGIWLVGVLVLFIPETVAGKFGIDVLRNNYRAWIGLATLAAFAFWVVQLIPGFQQRRLAKLRKKEVLKSLDSLSSEEWFLLAYCLHRGQQTICLKMGDKAATALCQKGLLVCGTGVGDPLGWPFTIPMFVWEHLLVNRSRYLPNPLPPELEQSFRDFDQYLRRYDHLFGL